METSSLEDVLETIARDDVPSNIPLRGETWIPPPTLSRFPHNVTPFPQPIPPGTSDLRDSDDWDWVLEGMEWEDIVSTFEAAVHDVMEDNLVILDGPSTSPAHTLTVPSGDATPINNDAGQSWEQIEKTPELVSVVQATPQKDEFSTIDILGLMEITSIPKTSPAPPPPSPPPLPPPPPILPPPIPPSASSTTSVISIQAASIVHGVQNLEKNPPVVTMPPGTSQIVPAVLYLNEDMVFGISSSQFALPQPQSTKQKKIKPKRKQNPGETHIKKPLNAFMLFSQEQKMNIMEELKTTSRQMITTALGQRWKALPIEEQEKYFVEARRRSQLHALQYPDWTPNNNKRGATDLQN